MILQRSILCSSDSKKRLYSHICVVQITYHISFKWGHRRTGMLVNSRGINTIRWFLILLLLFSTFNKHQSGLILAWSQPRERRIQITENCLRDMAKPSSYPWHFGLKICQNTSQTLTDKNRNLLQEPVSEEKIKTFWAASTYCLLWENNPLFCCTND